MIYQTGDQRFVISSGGCWLPGVYVDERAARYAFRFSNEQLHRLNSERGVGVDYRLIGFADLQEFRRREKAS